MKYSYFLMILYLMCIHHSQAKNLDCNTLVSQDIKELEFCANEGHSFSQYNLAAMYKLGINTSPDFDKSFYWFYKAAKQGFTEAQTNLSWFFENGISVKKDDTQAFHWAKLAAEKGEPIALNNLGVYYRYGIGIERDLKKSISYFKLSLEKAPELPIAKINLSYAYFYGLGIEKKQEEAIRLIQSLAVQGDELAMTNLGTFYEKLGKDNEAFFWTKKAAEIGNSLAQANLGNQYAKGIGVKVDSKKALYWLAESMKKNQPQAFFIMGTLYAEKNALFEQDDKKAFELFSHAAKMGNGNAQNNLGTWFLNGRYVNKDEKTALNWYLKAANENNVSEAMYTLSQLYAKGSTDIPQDTEQAQYWLNKAKEYGFKHK